MKVHKNYQQQSHTLQIHLTSKQLRCLSNRDGLGSTTTRITGDNMFDKTMVSLASCGNMNLQFLP